VVVAELLAVVNHHVHAVSRRLLLQLIGS
jgi:hypothetical protein